MTTPKRILVIQTAFIGDVILTTPLFEAMATHWPESKIDVLVVPKSKNVLENNPNLFNIIEYDKRGTDKGFFRFLRLVKKLKNNRYDLVLLPHRSFRSASLALMTGVKERIGFSKGFKHFYTRTVTYHSDVHEIERNLSLLSPFGFETTGIAPAVYPGEQDIAQVSSIIPLATLKKPVIALAPGSVWATKKWPENYYAQLAKDLTDMGHSVVLVGGPDDKTLCERIKDHCHSEHIYNTAGQLSLLQSAALLQHCSVLVCNDSGTLHLGVAAGTRVIAIFGPTVPAFGFYPFGKGHTVIEKDLPCRPCAIHGSNSCPIGTHACMLDIRPETVLHSVTQVIA